MDIFELPQFRLSELAPLLAEEVATWKQSLLWNYATSSQLVGQFVDAHALSGNVLCDRESPVGYSYFICEERKALIGCLYVSENYRNERTCRHLLDATLHSIRQRSGIRRIEAQFMLQAVSCGAPPLEEHVRVYERLFMKADLLRTRAKNWEPPLRKKLRVEPWNERFQDRAAYLIEEAYRGHLDAEINDQYQSVDGARRFLYNIIQYPGCGSFVPNASFVAIENGTGRLLAGCLASIVDERVGHITQVCTVPEARGVGLGRFLIERSLDQLWAHGCTQVTLTVTAANTGAIRLYTDLGFGVARRFPAYVWDRL